MPRRQTRRPQASDNRRQVRIIGGRWRGRKLRFADVEGLRPSGDRIRETLFNWLAPRLPGARCLDLFAGSGALGFEALSRGAAQAVMLEKDATAASMLRSSAAELAAGTTASVIETDALVWLVEADQPPFDIVFLDPPFASSWYANVLALLLKHNRLHPDALVYVESDQPLDSLGIGAPWTQLREKRAGVVYHGLYRAESDQLTQHEN